MVGDEEKNGEDGEKREREALIRFLRAGNSDQNFDSSSLEELREMVINVEEIRKSRTSLNF